MASLAVWKGQSRLSLVAIGIELHSATHTGARVSFRQIHGLSGKRVRDDKTVPGIGSVVSGRDTRWVNGHAGPGQAFGDDLIAGVPCQQAWSVIGTVKPGGLSQSAVAAMAEAVAAL